MCLPAQVLSELLDALAMLLTTKVTPANQTQHNLVVAKLRDEIAQAKEYLNAENTRMATERAALEREVERLQEENFRLSLDRDTSNIVFNRRHVRRLPPVYDARNLFNMPGAGAGNPPGVDRAVEVPVAGAPVQPCVVDPPRLNLTPPQHVPTPLGHYFNPLDNLIATDT